MIGRNFLIFSAHDMFYGTKISNTHQLPCQTLMSGILVIFCSDKSQVENCLWGVSLAVCLKMTDIQLSPLELWERAVPTGGTLFSSNVFIAVWFFHFNSPSIFNQARENDMHPATGLPHKYCTPCSCLCCGMKSLWE